MGQRSPTSSFYRGGKGDPTCLRSSSESGAENVCYFRSSEEVCETVTLIEAEESAFTEPHLCASISLDAISLYHMSVGSICPSSCPQFSLTQMILTLENKDIRGLTWAIAPTLTALGYLLILLVTIFPFWVRLVNEESHEVFYSGSFENCFHTKCLKPQPLPSKEGPRRGLGRDGAVAGTGGGRGQAFISQEGIFLLSLHSFGVKGK